MATAVITQQPALTVRLCSECGEPIPAARLKAKPNARQCVPCLEAAGDVTLSRRFVEQAGQVEKLFKGDESNQKVVERHERGEVAADDEHTAERFFSTDDERPTYDPNVSTVAADVPAHELDELNFGQTVEVQRSSPTVPAQEQIDPNYRGQIRWNVQCSRWILVFCWHSLQRFKTIGSKEQFPTRDDASRAAEPLREWFRNHPEVFKSSGRMWHDETLDPVTAADLRAERSAIAADIVKAKREESERRVERYFDELARKRDAKHYVKCSKVVLGIYLDRRAQLAHSRNIRGVRYTDASSPQGNYFFKCATTIDFCADVDIAARAVLTQPLHTALWRLLYTEARYSVELAEKSYASTVDDMHALLGREFERRGISPTHEYFRPFKAPKPKQVR